MYKQETKKRDLKKDERLKILESQLNEQTIKVSKLFVIFSSQSQSFAIMSFFNCYPLWTGCLGYFTEMSLTDTSETVLTVLVQPALRDYAMHNCLMK